LLAPKCRVGACPAGRYIGGRALHNIIGTRQRQASGGIQRGPSSFCGGVPPTPPFVLAHTARYNYPYKLGTSLNDNNTTRCKIPSPSLITQQLKEHSSPHFYEAWINASDCTKRFILHYFGIRRRVLDYIINTLDTQLSRRDLLAQWLIRQVANLFPWAWNHSMGVLIWDSSAMEPWLRWWRQDFVEENKKDDTPRKRPRKSVTYHLHIYLCEGNDSYSYAAATKDYTRSHANANKQPAPIL